MTITKEKVFLKKLNKEVVLDFFTIADDEYLMNHHGEEAVKEALTKFKPEVILDIFWLALSKEDKRTIRYISITSFNGLNESKIEFTDHIHKLKHIISGADELLAIWNAIIQTRAKSIPELKENEKKKRTAKKS